MSYSYSYRKRNKARTTRLAVAGVFIVGALWFLFLSPALTGYSIYQKAISDNKTAEDYLRGVDSIKTELGSQIAKLGSDISTCSKSGNEATNNLAKCLSDWTACKSDLQSQNSSYASKLNDCETEIENVNKTKSVEIEGLKTQLDKKSEDYVILANNTARSACCKSKIDNPNIKFYKVENNKVICSEDSGIELGCSL